MRSLSCISMGFGLILSLLPSVAVAQLSGGSRVGPPVPTNSAFNRPIGRMYNPLPRNVAPIYGPAFGWNTGFGVPLFGYPMVNSPITINIIPQPAAAAPLPTGPRNTVPHGMLSNRAEGTLSVILPGPGEIWMNGVKQPGRTTDFRFTSPLLQSGESYTFTIRAEWMARGERVGATDKVTVLAGESRQIAFGYGDPILPAPKGE